MNDSINKTSNMINNSKIKLTETNKQNTKTLNNTNSLFSLKSTSNKQQKNLSSSSITSTQKSIKKTLIEYNGVGDNPIESEKNTLYSTWTPLSDDSTNNKVK